MAKESTMKISGVFIFLQYAKNFKSNLVLLVVLVLESKGLQWFVWVSFRATTS